MHPEGVFFGVLGFFFVGWLTLWGCFICLVCFVLLWVCWLVGLGFGFWFVFEFFCTVLFWFYGFGFFWLVNSAIKRGDMKCQIRNSTRKPGKFVSRNIHLGFILHGCVWLFVLMIRELFDIRQLVKSSAIVDKQAPTARLYYSSEVWTCCTLILKSSCWMKIFECTLSSLLNKLSSSASK